MNIYILLGGHQFAEERFEEDTSKHFGNRIVFLDTC